MRNFIQPGRIITIPAPVDTASSDLVVIGSLVGVACGDAAAGSDLDIERNAVFGLPKNGTDTFAVGDSCYFDATNKLVTSTATGNTLVGTVVQDAAATDAVVSVLIR
ncbi:hypothetical protein CFR73_09580 [Novacetimonas maltaceti]|uniref:DUF2190 family protein n=1 Tax=Novacetimonas maltaceti TaxID=1203393 RepID=A0A2S3W3U2_9PROT|nr:DUF2190 family protein [Novacetimonas maltaceti]POF63555.1 hypothetical protein KMAL_07350 [Novacetimonas maltaceti]PYD59828.1 hypothetical protein CFR73_09580 [Novacetimonas maltaceti]